MSKNFEMNVWQKVGRSTLSRRAFYAVIGGVLSWGFLLTAMIAALTEDANYGGLMMVLMGIGIPVAGILISSKSENPAISFLGFNLVVIGIASLLGPVLAQFEFHYPGIVTEAALLTMIVTAMMGLSGILFPQFYSKIGGALFAALLALVIVSILGLFFPVFRFGFLPYISALLFSLYIGYDMWRASVIPATLDNAVDVCVSLYLDIINLFLRILEILAKSRK